MLVILTEEPSMKLFIETLVRRYFPNLSVKVKAYRGKQDLEKGIPKILKSWQIPNTYFIVVHDQDSWDCRVLKHNLKEICDSIRSGVVIRIACTELESWYWGDLVAVERAFNRNGLTSLMRKKKYRVPDNIINPKDELKKHLPKYEQQAGARVIAENIDAFNNTSYSFNKFFQSLSDMARLIAGTVSINENV